MGKKLCSFRFDDEFIRLLEALTGLCIPSTECGPHEFKS